MYYGECNYKNSKPEGIPAELADCIIRILDYCGKEGIDIEEAVKIKHQYNKTRPYRHGGKKI
jgi:NTP pyrophosphatase (non-canonical NTP hydrolase)